MAEIKTFRDLIAWQVGMEMMVLTYDVTADFPAHERFGLVSQMRRAAVSVPSNVAEGQAVGAARWSMRYIVTAIGSATELDTQIEAAIRLRFTDRTRAQPLIDSLDRSRSCSTECAARSAGGLASLSPLV